MRVAACYIVYYGKEYLRQSIEACSPFVDTFFALYTNTGSQGRQTSVPCPDTEEEMRACFDGVSDRLVWHHGQYHNESQHRNRGYELAKDYDIVLQHDTDEIYKPEDLEAAIKNAYDGSAKWHDINGFVHFWRSFDWACTDVWQPTRIIKNKGDGHRTLDAAIYHMSYAQGLPISEHKWRTSGHASELRPEWWQEKFLANAKDDVHPTTRAWWYAKPFDKSTLPECLKNHPNFGKEVVV